MSSTVAAVVLCGGQGRRFGGDKTSADLAGRPVLDHLLDGLPAEWDVVCVGLARPTRRAVRWCREEPPGGGPVAAVAAALPLVDASVAVLLGGDMPYAAGAAPELAARLASTPEADAVVGAGSGGRLQPLLGAYRVAALSAAVPSPPAGTPLMRVVDRLSLVTVPVTGDADLDVDTPADLDRARHRLEG